MRERVEVGRAVTLVDWEGGVENRAYVSLYAAEDILNWRPYARSAKKQIRPVSV